MAKRKFHLYILHDLGDKWIEPGIRLNQNPLHEYKETGSRFVCLGEVDVEIEVPDVDVTGLQIEALERELKQERADSQLRQNILLDRISKLKAITHEVAANELP